MPESKAYVIAMLVVFIFGIMATAFIIYTCFIPSYNHLPLYGKIGIAIISFCNSIKVYEHYKKAYKNYKEEQKENNE
jgi:hypothetical protein